MRNKLSLKLAVFVLFAAILACGVNFKTDMSAASTAQAEVTERPKYVFYLIGDGMGQSHRTIATIAKNNIGSAPKGQALKPLTMDSFPVIGMNTTQSYDQLVTDSAAAGTALACGVKTDNKSIGQTPDGKRLKSVLEGARDNGWSTGLVTTTRITHATPAAFAAHIDHRDKEDQIAAQLVDSGVNVLLGGGERFFLPQSAKGSKRKDERNLYDELKAKNYNVLNTADALRNFKPSGNPANDKLIGLYNNSHLTWDIDRDPAKEPSLAELTQKAVDVLSENNNGFFLMVEGGRIDHAAHQHDAAGIIKDTLAFDDAVTVAYNFYLKHPKETLILVVADHETGGLGLGTMNDYFLDPSVLNNVHGTMEKIGQAYNKHKNIDQLWSDFHAASGISYASLSSEEKARVEQAISDTKSGVTPWNDNIEAETLVGSALTEILNSRAHVGFTTYAHTGSAVPLTAIGSGSTLFGRLLDNTEVGRNLANLMNVKL
ncbi:alkaline phosphatase [Azotosporobacter soli]|uniref:alkaline phosphatase n=1 Tax=Azotosporobacter soli TaxID=3055040 RepID=UPI0031FEC97E